MSSLAAPLLAGLIVLPAAQAPVAADRHPGFWRFGPAPAEACKEQVRRDAAKPVKPQRLTELPPAYAIRLGGPACTTLLPSK